MSSTVPVATAVTTSIDIPMDKIAGLIAEEERVRIKEQYDKMTAYKMQLDYAANNERMRQSKEMHEQRKKHEELLFFAQNPTAVVERRERELQELENRAVRVKQDTESIVATRAADARSELLLAGKRRADVLFRTKFIGYMLVGIGLAFIATAASL